MEGETDNAHAARIESARRAAVVAAAADTAGGVPMTSKIIKRENGVFVDTYGKMHFTHRRFSAIAIGGIIRWSRILLASVKCDILQRPKLNGTATGGPNVVIPCMLLRRRIDVQWMHGKVPWFMCTKSSTGISNSEFIAAMHFKDIRYGQFTVSTSDGAPFFIMKYGVKSGRGAEARLNMLKFCMSHNYYKEFRSHIRESAWDMMNNNTKVDLTTLRLAVCFVDFVNHPRVAALFDLDKKLDREKFAKHATKRNQPRN